ncbi:MAG: alpha/beta hydrolase [Patescibacteria group bacterium]
MEITINGIKTNYQIFGEGLPAQAGKPFLILHGWGSSSERWQAVGEHLSQFGHMVIIPDLPGFGASDAPKVPWNLNKYVNWAEQFIKELNLNDFYLLGHSFGGALAFKIAVKHVQDIKKLFLISAACVRKKTPKKNIFTKISKVVKIFYFFPYYNLFRKAVYKFIIRKSDYIYFEGIMKETYLNIVSEDLSLYLSFIKTPTVIIWGQEDEATPLENGYFIAKQIKNSKIIVIPDAGHSLNKEQPLVLAEKIINNL